MNNTVKTALLLGTMSALLLLIGQALGGAGGMAIGFVLAVATNFASYWFSDKIVLRMYNAQEVGRGHRLFDIVDRPIASVQGYDYSKKMRAASKQWKVWDQKHLDQYLTHPREVLHGVKMYYAVPDAKDRADVIAYLNTLK